MTPAAKPREEATTRGDAMLTQNTTQAPRDEAAPAPMTCGKQTCECMRQRAKESERRQQRGRKAAAAGATGGGGSRPCPKSLPKAHHGPGDAYRP